MRIFLSYTTRDHRDRALAQRIADGLKARAVDVFFAPRSIRSGADWKEVLRTEISSRCTHILVVLSAASLGSPEVREEIDLALARFNGDRAFQILPLVTGHIAEDPLSRFHQVVYENDPEKQIENIAAELGLPPQSASERALKPSSQRLGDKGDLVPRLCDRRDQEHSFRSAFHRHLKDLQRAPQVYFISGAEGERHGSLVDRFQMVFMYEIASLKDRDASVSNGDVPWPLSTDLDEAMDELMGELFGLFDARYRSSRLPVTPADFRQLTANRPEPIVVVQHEIRSTGWSRVTAPLVERYLKFWSDVATLQPGPQFVVFFNVVLCDSDERNAEALSEFVQSLTADPDEPKPFWKRLGSILAAPEAARAPLPKNIAVTALPPLQPVRREDVDDWFDQRGQKIGFEKRQRVCEELFRSATVRRMADVERRLTAIFFEHNLAEGRA